MKNNWNANFAISKRIHLIRLFTIAKNEWKRNYFHIIKPRILNQIALY